MSEASERAGAFFGRRKGKKLRAGQDELVHTLLPAIRVAPGSDLPGQFANPAARETWLEIGFGGGEHLAAQARTRRDVNFVGCEPFVNGMAKLLATVQQESLDNIRVWDDDVTKLLPALPDASFDRVYILYPDPWPKRRQRKRRLVSDEMLAMLARVMKPGGELRFASDIDDYIGWVLARALRSSHFRWTATRADDWRKPYDGWPGTRYEAKAIREGRVPSYLTFVRV
ncbi:tRNA (guanine(46)-N(7))-methyltransferase TrmB [Microvirga arsenatis]|uniref:tRNA (guanine-N(7)-)-methyltransferase n=1 Tax=Microvirga arsenatis TaxID=2692265 RepID=A0ABW9YUJ1_9HYPH|nr:tRNA (guanine(46)-N(7))-methyltransferase TrmB [Microvirga arsenatis]NBJ13570.1 tRNA (guanosine(46)-N7)-methyltransferase TrmB [Microvirga arsenatis]NBJ23879.1 tRNA (guanosine(46)-N7)-methyltransferase TrmB [Microvirga arsenatis]